MSKGERAPVGGRVASLLPSDPAATRASRGKSGNLRRALGDLDDATLLARSRDGDTDALATLFGRYQAPLYRLAVGMLHDRGDAEDAVQEGLVSAWRRLPTYRGEGSVSSWLYRIVTNRCLNTARTRLRRPATPDAGAGVSVAAPTGSGHPEAEAEAAELRAALRAAVAGLSPEQRACWVLREANGLSYDDIASVLGVSTDTVRGRIQRARHSLAIAMRELR